MGTRIPERVDEKIGGEISVKTEAHTKDKEEGMSIAVRSSVGVFQRDGEVLIVEAGWSFLRVFGWSSALVRELYFVYAIGPLFLSVTIL